MGPPGAVIALIGIAVPLQPYIRRIRAWRSARVPSRWWVVGHVWVVFALLAVALVAGG